MRHRREKGYSLVEVLIAAAITAVVVMSIFTVITLAQRNVKSGKQLTAANAVATRVLEDLSLMSATDIQLNFGLTDSTTLGTNTVGGVDYAGSVLRDSNAIGTGQDPSGYLARWHDLVPPETFRSGRVVLVITPANPRNNGAPVTTAQVIRVRGFVEWREGGLRERRVSFESSKLQRPVI